MVSKKITRTTTVEKTFSAYLDNADEYAVGSMLTLATLTRTDKRASLNRDLDSTWNTVEYSDRDKLLVLIAYD